MFDREGIDAAGSVYGSDAPIFLARGTPYNLMLHAKYGLEMYSNAIITQRAACKRTPDQCRALVDGAMEALKFSFLDPDKTTDIHLDTVKEYVKAPAATGHSSNTGCSSTRRPRWPPISSRTVSDSWSSGWSRATQEKIAKYLGMKATQDPASLYTNQFAGKVKLTPEEWSKVRASVKDYTL